MQTKMTINIGILALTIMVATAIPQETGLIIDEYKLVQVSQHDPMYDGTIEFWKTYVEPVLEGERRNWDEMMPRVPHRSPTDSQRKTEHRKREKRVERKPLFGPVELEGEMYALRKVAKEVKGQWLEEDYVVEKNGETIHSFTAKGTPTDETIKAFFAWNGDWIIEHVNHVIVGGRNLNDELDYPKIFNYIIINDKPFFFFEKDEVVRINYGGVVQPDQYDQVAHYWCCEPGALNPTYSGHVARFFAVRDGYWYYIEAGVIADE